MDTRRKQFNFREVLIIMIIASLCVGLTSGYVVYRHFEKDNKIKDCGELISDSFVSEFLTKYTEITDNYFEDIDKKKLLESALSGMLEYLGDPYTGYMNEESANNLLEQLNGEYTGLGIEVVYKAEDEGVYIHTVFEGSPAEAAGLKPGDKFVSINGETVEGKNVNEVTDIIKNGDKAEFKLEVLRDEKVESITVTRKKINIPSVYTEKLENDIWYMRLTTFSNTTPEQVKAGIQKAKADGAKNLIIDVRDNSGGYLHSAEAIIEQFVKKGEVMYKVKTKEKEESINSKTNDSTDFEIFVLINGSSASASEILAGALKDTYGATLVGTKSYGKGKIQETSETSSGGLIKYTSAYWLTPSGYCVDEQGLTPDIEVALDEKYYENPIRDNDNQLQKVIETIKK